MSESICIREALSEQEREDIAKAAEVVMDGPIRSTDERIELVLAEAEARQRRRGMAVVRVCPHCGGRLSGLDGGTEDSR